MNYEEKCIVLDAFGVDHGMVFSPYSTAVTLAALNTSTVTGFESAAAHVGGFLAAAVTGQQAIYVSVETVAAMPLGQIKAILLHEQGHISRGHLTAMQAGGESGISSSLERELEADEWAMAHGANPKDLEAGLKVCVKATRDWIAGHAEEYRALTGTGWKGALRRWLGKANSAHQISTRIKKMRAFAAA